MKVLVQPPWTLVTARANLGFLFIDMADQRPLQAVEESNLKKFRNRLKRLFGRKSQSTPPTTRSDSQAPADLGDLAPTVPTEAAKLRAKYTHFRILVIGRANAGKTTLLKRVCNTEEDPVYSEVNYLLRLIPHFYHRFTDRLTRPRRYQLGDPCTLI